MADTTQTDSVVERVSHDRPAPAPAAEEGATPARLAFWLIALAASGAAFLAAGRQTLDRFEDQALLTSDIRRAQAIVETAEPSGRSADYYESIAEFAQIVGPDANEQAYAATRRALEKDDGRPYVWARLAWLETERTGVFNETAQAAMNRSMDVCPLCEPALIRWRLNFILMHWNETPEPLRIRAFEHADVLRWSGSNAEFLGEMRVKAQRAGLPFDDYRAAVDTPVRTQDVFGQ